ncbi:MAG: PAS domain S-box protein [Chitinophagaceae bacterium]|nr:PAS domain S-box protein [Chitinophagaceae bacterium]
MSISLRLKPTRFDRKRMLLTAFIVTLLLLVSAIYWFTFQNKWLIADYHKQNEMAAEQDTFDDLFLNIQAAESAMRGYAATGNPAFKTNFQAQINSIRTHNSALKEIQNRSRSSVDPQLFSAFNRLIKEKTEFMQRVNSLCELKNTGEAMALIATEKGIILTDSILKVHQSINALLLDSLGQSKKIFNLAHNTNNSIAFWGIAVSILCIILLFYLLQKEIKKATHIGDTLQLQKEHLGVTLKSISEGLITTGKDGKIIYMNPSAEKLTGWKNRDVKNKLLQSVYNVKNEETGKLIDNIVTRIIQEGRVIETENNTILQKRNGEKLVISNNGSPIFDLQGNIIGAVMVFNDITEKKRIADELKDNERQLRDMIENMPEAVYTCDRLGYLKIFNKAAVNLWGREPVAGQDRWCGSWKLFHSDGTSLPHDNSPMAIALKEARPVLGKEILIKRPDGKIRHVLPSPAPMFNALGELTGTVNMLLDITDKKEREILIQKTEEKYRNLIEQASDAILIFSLDGTIKEFNNSVCSITGYSREEFIDRELTISDILVGDMSINPGKHQALLNGETITFYRQFKCRDNSEIDLEVKASLLEDGNILAFGRDVTERKRNEEKIKIAIERFEILSRATSDTIWDWDILNDSILYNHNITKMFGYTQPEIENGAKWWKNNIHPDDYNNVCDVLDDAFRSGTQTIQFEYRYHCTDHAYKNILDRAYIVYNADGLPVRMIGAMQDVTKEKEHERQVAIAITDAQEKERRELGMELHDNVNQLLGATLLYLGMAIKSGNVKQDETEILNSCSEYIHEAIRDLRNLSHRLTPYAKEEASLKEVIKMLVEPLQKTNQFKIDLQVEEIKNNTVDSDMQINLYRIVQEQLNNIVKHAGAEKVKIKLWITQKLIKVSISDNGKGFDPDSLKDGIGLENIKRRAEMFSGKIKLRSSPGNGCELLVELPLKKQPVHQPEIQGMYNLSR